MAETAGTIQLSVQFKDAISNFKKVVDSLQGELNKLTPGTSIYKAIESDLKQAQKLVNKTDLQANTGLNKIGQLDTMVGDLQRVEGLLSRVQQLFGSVDLSHVNLNHESFATFTQDIQAAKTELANLAKAKSELEGKNVKGLLASAGYTEAQMKKAGFKASDLDQNAIEYYERLGQAAAEAQQKVENLNQAQKSAQTLVNNNQAFLDSNKNAATIGSLTGQLKGKYTGNDIARVYGNFVDQQHQQGTLQSDHVQNTLRLIGLDEATINQIITSGADAKKRLEEALKNLYPNHGQNEYWGLKGAFEKNLKNPTQVGANTGGVSGRTGFSTALKEQERATEEQLKHQQEVAQLQKETATAEKQVAKLETKSSTLGNVISKTDYANLNTQINNIQSRIATLESKILGSVQSAGLTPGGGGSGIPTPPPDDPSARAQNAKQQAQNQMGSAIDAAARRWIGTYAIVNKVRQAIRQAWTDIKALDKTMTDIAVVTNMSTEQLWGKVSEYMSIAQQYGVTTQGTYQVSQLYYQQGLSTSEVMAATTETLKMARIAGMEYSEATNAMTVAIRSFKMEMTDASRITDVYSKVAAITASDSEELATAMSKTASSAENVGSSFENTTAMLAVMIETTRESAQNLGSALKSIISRYGEMKVGATVDAEGEALDYNKVDTALQSVGISLKDAQGQFRDFDTVIFELSEKWDSLDSVTQRYIATIMAGNRQQSRFIALVDNWERLDEVAGAAKNAEDAGLIQYSKTLESLESRLNNVKTSFQEMYMSIANGPAFGAIIEWINDMLQGFNKFKSNLIMFFPSLIASIKGMFTIIKALSTSMFSGLYANAVQSFQLTAQANIEAHANAEAVKTSTTAQQSGLRVTIETGNAVKSGQNKISVWKNQNGKILGGGSKAAGMIGIGATMAGTALTAWGANVAGQGGSKNVQKGAMMSAGGNILSSAGMGLMMAGPWGALAGGFIGLLTSTKGLIDAFDKTKALEEDRRKAQEEYDEANLKRAETKENYNKLSDYITKLRQLESTRFDSQESYDEWIKTNAEALEAFPQLTSKLDGAKNAIVDLTSAEEQLTIARIEASEAAKDAANKQIAAALASEAVAEQQVENVEKDRTDIYTKAQARSSQLYNHMDYAGSLSDLVYMPTTAYGVQGIPLLNTKASTRKKEVLAFNEAIMSKFNNNPKSNIYITDNQQALEYNNIQGRNTVGQAFGALGKTVILVPSSNGMGYTAGFKSEKIGKAAKYFDLTPSSLEWLGKLSEVNEDEFYEMIALAEVGKDFQLKEGANFSDVIKILTNKKYSTQSEIPAAVNTAAREKQKAELAVTSAIRSGVQTYIDSYYLGVNKDETFLGLNGTEDVLSKVIIEAFNEDLKVAQEKNSKLDPSDYWKSWIEGSNFSKQMTSLELLYDDFYSSLQISGNIDNYNAFIEKSSFYNTSDFEQRLTKEFGLDTSEGLGEILFQQFTETYNKARDTFISSLKNVSFLVDTNGEWLEGITNPPEIPKEFMDEATAYARNLESYVKSGRINASQARSQWTEYTAIWDQIDDLKDPVQEAMVTRIFGSADLTSPNGVAKLINELITEAGLSEDDNLIKNIENILPEVIVNLNASCESYLSEFATYVDSQADQLKKAEQGFSSLADTKAFADKMGLALEDFSFEDGKWFLKYSQNHVEKIKASIDSNLDKERKFIKQAYDDQVSAINSPDISTKLNYTEDNKDYDAKTLIETLNLGDSDNAKKIKEVINQHWENYKTWAATTNEAEKTFIKYLEVNYETTMASLNASELEYLTWIEAELKRSSAIREETKKLTGGEAQVRVQEAWSSIASKGLSGYSATDIAKLKTDLGISGELGIEQSDGTYDLDLSQLQNMPQFVRNKIQSLIQKESESARTAIENIGDKLFEASDSDYEEAFSYLVKAGFQGKDIKQGINYALMKAIVGDPKDLEQYIGQELAYREGRNYEDASFIEEYGAIITETRENMVAASKDQITKQYGRFAEILQKKILGTATFEELEELNDLELKLNLDLSSFTGRLVDDLTSFAQEIIDNAYLSTEDKQKYLQAAFGSILDIKAYSQIFGVDETDVTPEMAAIIPDVYSSNKELRSSRNRLSQDKAKEMMTNYALAMGIRPETLSSLITFNESDLTFSFGKGKTPFQMMKDTIWAIAKTDSKLKKQLEDSGYDKITTIEKLAEVVDNADNAQALNVLGSAELFEQLADAQLQSGYFDQEYRAEKYISAVESFASGQEMTFEELTKLYQDLGLTFDTAELYQLWLSGPEALAAKLLKLGTNDSGLTNEQKKSIQNAQDRGVETLLNNIASIVDKVIEGSATLDDLFSLGKNLGINLSGKVYKTSSGYGLTQEGLVEVAGARAMRTGDYTTEGRLLVESYYGHGGMFDNVAALEAEISSRLKKDFKFEAADLNIAGTLLRQASKEYEEAIYEWEKANKEQTKDEKKITVEDKKILKEQKELNELNMAQAKVLQTALAAATRREAENAANFMGIDPFDGAAEHYKNYKSSRETAQTALQEAYQNKGFIKDFNQAGQLLRFIGYGEGWDPETRREKLSTIFKYDSDKGVNFAAVLREVLGDSYNFTGMTDAEVLLEAARLMNDSEKKMKQKMYEDQLANETWGQTQKEIIADSKKRLVPEGATVDRFITSKKVGEEMVSTLDSARLSEYVTKTYGKLGLTKEAFEGLAKTRYGDDWQTALANTDTLKSFLQYIDKTTTGFKYDSSSDQTSEEQYLAHLQGDTAAQKVDERLKALEEHLSGLTTDASAMDGLNEGLDLSIEKAKFLNYLLSENELGTVLTTGTTTVEGQQQHSGYIQTKKQLEEVTPNEIDEYKKHLATTYGLNEEETKKINYDNEKHILTYKPDNASPEFKGFTYTLTPPQESNKATDNDVPGGVEPKPPLNGKVIYTGEFDEVNEWIAENEHIQAVYTLSTPEVAKNNVEKQIQAILKEYNVKDAAALSSKINSENNTLPDLDKAKADLAKLQKLLKLQNELNTRYPDTDKEPGVVDSKINGKVPENDKELAAFKDMVNRTLEGLGDVPLTFTVGEGDGAKALDTKGLQEYINSLSEGQELVLSTSVLEGTGLEDINAIAVAFNAIADNLKTAKINLETEGLDADKVNLINNLTAALKNYDSANPDGTQRNVTLNVIGAENADKWVKNLYDNLTQLDEAKEFNSALNLTVNLTDGKGHTVSYVDSYSNLLTENAALSGTVSDLTTIADSQKAQIADLTSTNGELQTTNAELEAANAALQTENTSLASNNSDLAEKNASLEETIAANNAAITALEAERDELKAQLAAESATNTAAIAELNIKLSTAEGEIARLTRENWALLGQLNAKGGPEKQSDTEGTGQEGTPQQTPAPLPTPQPGPTPPAQQAPKPEVEMQAEEVVITGDTGETQTEEVVITGPNGETLDPYSQTNTDILTLLQQRGISPGDYYKFIREQNNPFGAGAQPTQTPPPVLPINTPGPTSTLTLNTDEAETQASTLVEEVNNQQATLTITGDSTQATNTANTAKTKIDGLRATMNIYGRFAGLIGAGGLPIVDMMYSGNVNGIAYADGNVDKLVKGAHLAHKTLVGELGPELGVWDGQYHLLGRDGAEFVNMPSDAIVFNHRQTEGILKGQMGHRGKALADGNVSPARASSDGWQHVYGIWPLGDGFKSYDDFLKSLKSSGKKSVKTTDLSDEDLEEWYNLLRKIAKLEAEINLLQAERENMLDGHDILKSYREEQAYLNEQIAVQKLLIDYQKEQLKLEAERIKQDKWWSKSLTFNEDGTLLSIFGNEVGGGKGVFAYLDMLNNMSGDQQVAALKALGYSYKGKDGKALEGEKLVKQFVKEYKEVVSDYNDLESSIYEGQTKVEQLTKAISDLETQIIENQKELEKSIYDLLVEAAELEIEQMEEQHKLIQEANEKYIKGLNDALSKEQDLYESNQSIEKREALQRELSLLRRSGGSASEIAELEQQLDDTLKTEYFDKQQQMIEDINEANERQTELMERQVKLQEDALEYQKENGVLWTKVYEILGGSYEEILAFFTGHDTEFFKASVLEQESMLLEWAKMVGIYDEDRISKQAKKDAGRLWEDGTIEQMLANDKTVSEYTDKEGKKQTKTRQQQYNELSDKDKKAAQDHYNAAYADAVLRGQDSETASRTAYDSMVERFRLDKDVGITRFDPRVGGSTSGSGNNNSGNTQYVNITYQVTPPEAKAAGCSISGPSRVAVGTQKGGIVVKTAKGWAKAGWTSSNSTVAQISSGVITAHKKGSVTITQKYWKCDDDYESKANSQSETAIRDEHTGILEETFINKGGFKITNNGTTLFTSSEKYKTKDEAKSAAQSKMATYDSTTYPKLKYSLYGFSQGGLVDYTGLAVVHGSQSKPEAFLNASQTAQITEALRETTGKESVLEGLRSTMDKLRALVHNISTIDNSSNQNISIAPGAVVIQVEQLADSYDIDEVSRDVMNRMVTIANKATNRGVNRR